MGTGAAEGERSGGGGGGGGGSQFLSGPMLCASPSPGLSAAPQPCSASRAGVAERAAWRASGRKEGYVGRSGVACEGG